jgi:hypothetical protein
MHTNCLAPLARVGSLTTNEHMLRGALRCTERMTNTHNMEQLLYTYLLVVFSGRIGVRLSTIHVRHRKQLITSKRQSVADSDILINRHTCFLQAAKIPHLRAICNVRHSP